MFMGTSSCLELELTRAMLKRELQKATCVEEIPDSFEAEPLTTQTEMNNFYVETMEARTGDPDESPILEIERACKTPRERNAMLLLGHRGCGKSTELNDMKLRLEKENRPVVIIQCEEQMALANQPEYSDLLILMGDTLLNLARKLDVPILPGTAKTIERFWTPGERVSDVVSEADVEMSAGVEVASPSLIATVINLFAGLKESLKYNETIRTTYKERLTKNYEDWKRVLSQLSDGIWKKIGKQPVLIFEGLDRMNQEEARNVFFEHARSLSDVSFPVIYTFPIALYYENSFPSIEHEFRLVTVFPMLKLERVDGSPYKEGVEKLKEIVNRRVNSGVIDDEALKLMIEKTGGSLRDLFRAIRTASQRAMNRAYRTGIPERVTEDDAKRALTRLKSDITSRIEGDDEFELLTEIYNGKRTKITNREMLLRLLQARIVMEYNGERWFNVHPLVADYLRDLGYVN